MSTTTNKMLIKSVRDFLRIYLYHAVMMKTVVKNTLRIILNGDVFNKSVYILLLSTSYAC